MNINLRKLGDLVQVNPNEIHGRINGKLVIVRRSLQGWSPQLEILIDGIRCHYAEATEADKKSFNDLSQAAWARLDDKRRASRESISKEMEELFT